MKKIFRLLMATLLCGVLLGSCELETSGNGDLDGLWHLERVDTIMTGGVANMSSDRIYWAFQLKLMQLEDKNNQRGRFLFRFEQTADSLKLTTPYIYDRDEGDKVLEVAEPLRPFGINALDDKFKINHLDGSKMQLQTSELILSFKKV